MRIVKSSIGWLSFIMLVTGIVLTVLWVYYTAQPFFYGSTMYLLRDPSVDILAETLESVNEKADHSKILKDWVTVSEGSPIVYRGAEAVLTALANGGPPRSTVRKDTAAVAITNQSGKVLMAYPPVLMEKVPYLDEYNAGFEIKKILPDASGSNKWKDVRLSGKGDIVRLVAFGRWPLISGDSETAAYKVPGWVSRTLTARLPEANAKTRMFKDGIYKPGLPLYLILLSLILIPIWVGLDASWRGSRPYAWAIFVIITGAIGLLAYLIARPPAPGRCGNCDGVVLRKYVRCPECGMSLMHNCPICGAKMKPGWQVCPRCSGVPRQPVKPKVDTETPTISEPKPAPEIKQAGVGSLKTRVLEEETSAPVIGAKIVISGPTKMDGITSYTGEFSSCRLEPGEYKVLVSMKGYQDSEASVQIHEKSCAELIIVLKSEPGSIEGYIKDADCRKPIIKARVSIDSVRVDASAETGEDGTYLLSSLPPGPYTVCTEADGFSQQTKLAEVKPGSRSRLDFTLIAVFEKTACPKEETENE